MEVQAAACLGRAGADRVVEHPAALETTGHCRSGCETAHSKCLDTCEGTWENPKPSRNCLICDENYQRCSRACSRNIA